MPIYPLLLAWALAGSPTLPAGSPQGLSLAHPLIAPPDSPPAATGASPLALSLVAAEIPGRDPCTADATAPGLDAFARAVRSARARLAADGGALWGRPLGGEWVAFARVGESICGYATARPAEGEFAPVRVAGGDTLWAGVIPPAVNPANTSIRWAGRRWAGILLPLPRDTAAADRLLIHELAHTLQPRGDDSAGTFLPLPPAPEGGAGSDQLEGAEGRTLLRLELRALARALTATTDDVRRRAGAEALLFRSTRQSRATVNEQQRQRGLDVGEGVPEYTAWRLVTHAESRAGVARALLAADRRADDTTAAVSFTRSFPYLTGPAYGLLLDELAPGWRDRLMRGGADADLQALLAVALTPATRRGRVAAAVPHPGGDSAALHAASASYGGEAVAAAERARAARNEEARRQLRARFVDEPTLRLRPGALQITFDPNGQTSFGVEGTVMRGLTWKGSDGAELRAPAGALVSASWTELRVPLDPAPAARLQGAAAGAPLPALDIEGSGWTLRLPAGWLLDPAGASWILRPPPAR